MTTFIFWRSLLIIPVFLFSYVIIDGKAQIFFFLAWFGSIGFAYFSSFEGAWNSTRRNI